MMKVLIIIVLILVLGGFLLYQNFYSQVTDEQNPDSGVSKSDDDFNGIVVISQRPGNFMVVNFVKLTNPGYIVIQDNNDGNPGNIIGNSRVLSAGESQMISVGLVRPVLHGESLFAVLYEDSGDGVFTPAVDVPLKDEHGNIIFMRLRIDQNADRIE